MTDTQAHVIGTLLIVNILIDLVMFYRVSRIRRRLRSRLP